METHRQSYAPDLGDRMIKLSSGAEPLRYRSLAGALRFRRFQVLPEDRLLLRDGRSVDIGGRAFDLLLVLLRERGAVVDKTEIVDRVWPSTIVDESNLRFQMAVLRKVLGEDRDVIKTIQGRGYLLIADVAAPHPAEAVPQYMDGGTRSLVAVIDDDDDTREALGGLLQSAGLAVASFPSVRAFMDAELPTSPGCLVLDVWLPGCSGLEFQADLRQAGVRLPIIFISGHADVPMSVQAMKAGAVEFLTKPVRHQDLLDAIHSVIEPLPGRAAEWTRKVS